MKAISFVLLVMLCLFPGFCLAKENSGTFRGMWWNYYDRGVSSAERGDWDAAEKDLRKAISMRGKDQYMARTYGMHFIDYFPHREIGVVYLQKGDLAQAMREFEESIRLQESSKAIYFLNKARKMTLGRGGEARSAKPVIVLDAPTARGITKELQIKVKGSVKGEAFVAKVFINREPYRFEMAQEKIDFERSVDLEDGANSIVVTAEDLLGNRVEKVVTVMVKRDGPSIGIVSVGPAGEGGRIKLIGEVSDPVGIKTLQVDGKTFDVRGQLSYPLNLELERRDSGKKVLLKAADILDNVTEAEVVVPALEKTPPLPPAAVIDEVAAAAKAAIAKAAAEKAAAERAAAETAAIVKAAAERAAAERAAAERAAAERVAAERAAAERATTAKSAAEKGAADQAAAVERAAAERAAVERAAAERAAAERAAAERAAAERAAVAKAAVAKAAAERAAADRAAADRVAAEKVAAERAAAAIAAAEKAAAERAAAERAAVERAAAERAAAERAAAEKAAAAKAAAEKVAAEKVAAEKVAAEKAAAEKAAAKRAARDPEKERQASEEKLKAGLAGEEPAPSDAGKKVVVERDKLKAVLNEQKLSSALSEDGRKKIELGKIKAGDDTVAYQDSRDVRQPPPVQNDADLSIPACADSSLPDGTPPSLTLKDSADLPSVFVAKYSVEGEVTDNCRVDRVVINGKDVPIKKGRKIYFSKVVRLNKGENPVVVDSYDAAGNKMSSTFTITRSIPSVMKNDSHTSLVVLPFDRVNAGGDATSMADDYLAGSFVEQQRFAVVDRKKLKQILSEQKFTQAMLSEPDEAAKVGKITAAEMILATVVRENSNSIEVVSRVINTETSEVIDVKDAFSEDKSAAGIKELMDGLAAKIAAGFPLVEGTVIKRGSSEVYTDLGSATKIRQNMGAIFYRKGEEIKHPVTGKSLGFDTVKIGEGYIDDVQEGFSKVKLTGKNRDQNIAEKDLMITK